MNDPSRTATVAITVKTMLLAALVVALGWAIASILEALLIVFVGIFLALVFEGPTRIVQAKTGRGRGLSATIVVLGALVSLTILGLLLASQLLGGVQELLQDLPALVEEARTSSDLSSLGDTTAAGHIQDGANTAAANTPDSLAALVGLAGDAFSFMLAVFTITFTALFLLTDIGNLKRAAASVLMPDDADRWLDVFENITHLVSRWAIGVLIIATIAGTTQGVTAFLLGSSYAVALGLIAGLLDMIPNLGATIAGFILVPVIFAEEGTTAALIMLAVVLIYQQVENNLLTPTIQGKAVEISAFFIIIGVTLFGALLGVLGALVAVPVAASLQLIVKEATRARRAQVAAARAAREAT